jgi:hypothetical protein
LLSQRDPAAAEFDKENFLQKARLLNPQDLCSALTGNVGAAISNPCDSLPYGPRTSDEEWLNAVEELDARLPRLAAEGERLMDTAAQAMILNWKRSLEDHLESVVNGERGGLSLAAALVGDLLEHLHQSRPDSVAPATYGDPSPLTTEIRHALDGFPSDAAVLTRTAIAGVLCDTSVATASFAIVPKTFVLVGVVGGIGLLAAAVRHIARQHIRNRLAHLSETIRKKWQSLIETATLRVASKAFDSFIDHLQTTARELRAAGTRVGELVEYFHETYEPQWPTGTALWQVVAFGRAEIVSYEALCTARTDRPISTYLERSGKQFLWRRLASPQSDQPPNGWEGQIAEEAAIFTLSACTNIIDLTILAVLSQRPELLEAYQRVWVTASQPYLLTGGYAAVAGVLEAKPGNNGPVLSRLHSGLALQLEHLTTLFTAPGCRLTLTTFMEPTPITDVVTTG